MERRKLPIAMAREPKFRLWFLMSYCIFSVVSNHRSPSLATPDFLKKLFIRQGFCSNNLPQADWATIRSWPFADLVANLANQPGLFQSRHQRPPVSGFRRLVIDFVQIVICELSRDKSNRHPLTEAVERLINPRTGQGRKFKLLAAHNSKANACCR